MRVAHLLRKYNPAEWGGTETVIHQLFGGLRSQGVESVVYCPRLDGAAGGTGVLPVNGNGSSPPHRQDARATSIRDPLAEAGCLVNRFNACLPVWGISEEKR